MKIVRVGFEVPLDRLFDYRCDDARESDIGARVLAPFGKRSMVGVILEITDTSERLRQEYELLDQTRRQLAARTVLKDTFQPQ